MNNRLQEARFRIQTETCDINARIHKAIFNIRQKHTQWLRQTGKSPEQILKSEQLTILSEIDFIEDKIIKQATLMQVRFYTNMTGKDEDEKLRKQLW